jgi:ectoine hydroxylase-related dioxygenase (phytanoyl-CoA dioxygenase family)
MIYSKFDEDGYVILPSVLDEATIEALISDLSQGLQENEPADNRRHSFRNLFEIPGIRKLATSTAVRHLVEPILGPECFAVRAIYFDKVPGANWKVPWHQDLSVALAEEREAEGFGPWSRKAGVAHAQAPIWLLEQMVAVRLHLDACDASNGPLRVLPGTHRSGKLSAEQIEALRAERAEVVCQVDRGGALLMRPLLLHASSAAQSPGHRRVIHLEYACAPLPPRLEWHEAVRPD